MKWPSCIPRSTFNELFPKPFRNILFLDLLFHLELISNCQQGHSNSSLGIHCPVLGKPFCVSMSLPVVPQLHHLHKSHHLHMVPQFAKAPWSLSTKGVTKESTRFRCWRWFFFIANVHITLLIMHRIFKKLLFAKISWLQNFTKFVTTKKPTFRSI